MASKRKRVPGDVVLVDLGDGFHCYARVLEEGLFAFYDGRSEGSEPIEDIVNRPILFHVSVCVGNGSGG